MPMGLYMDMSGVQENAMEPFSTSTTRIRMSSLTGGGGKGPSMTALQYASPDIDATVACVAIGSCQPITRDCCAPRRVWCETLISRTFQETVRFTYFRLT